MRNTGSSKVQGCMFIVNSSQLTNKTAEDATESKYANGTHYYWNRSMLMPSPVPYRLAGTPHLGSTIFSNDHPDTISSILPAYSSSFHSYIFHLNTVSSQYTHHHHHHHHHHHLIMLHHRTWRAAHPSKHPPTSAHRSSGIRFITSWSHHSPTIASGPHVFLHTACFSVHPASATSIALMTRRWSDVVGMPITLPPIIRSNWSLSGRSATWNHSLPPSPERHHPAALHRNRFHRTHSLAGRSAATEFHVPD